MRAQGEWSEKVAKTWLGRPGVVQQLDAYVLGRATFHRNEEVAARKDNKDDRLARIRVGVPLAVRLDVVVKDVLIHGRRGRWYAAVCAICLTTELLLGAEDGATTFVGGLPTNWSLCDWFGTPSCTPQPGDRKAPSLHSSSSS